MKKLIIFIFLISFLLIFPVLAVVPVIPATDLDGKKTTNTPSSDKSIGNPLTISTPQQLIGKIIVAILGLVGSIALIMFIYGGVTWMTAAGSEDKIKKGKNILSWAVIGMVVIFSSYAILKLVMEDILGVK